MGSSGSVTHPVMPARPSDAPITLRNPRREALSSHSEAPLGNSRCKASWKAGLPASSSSERQYSGPALSFLGKAASCAAAASIFSRTTARSSFLLGQTSSRVLIWINPPLFFSSLVIRTSGAKARSLFCFQRPAKAGLFHKTLLLAHPKRRPFNAFLSMARTAVRDVAHARLSVGGFYFSDANLIFCDQVRTQRILIGESAAVHRD